MRRVTKKKQLSVIKFSCFAGGGGGVAPLREAGNLCFYVKFPIKNFSIKQTFLKHVS